MARGYLNKHLGNIPDDVSSDRRASTLNQKTGGDRGYGALDAGGVLVASGWDGSRSYTGKHLGNMPDDATTNRRAATSTQLLGGDRGAVGLDASSRLQTGVTSAATAADGIAGIESTKGSGTKAARNAGTATGRVSDDARRSGAGGIPTPGGRTETTPLYDATGATPLIDPVTQTIQPGLAIGTGVRGAADVAFGSTVKFAPNRHTERRTNLVDGSVFTYGVSFDNNPKVVITPLVYTAPAAGAKVQFTTVAESTSSCKLKCVSTSGSSSTSQTDNFSATQNTTPGAGAIAIQNQGAVAYCDLSHANANSTSYAAVYDVDTSAMLSSNTLYIDVYYNASATGTVWTLAGTASFGSGIVGTGYSVSFNAALGLDYDVRLVLRYLNTPGAASKASVTAQRVDYAVVTGGADTPLTSFADAGVQVQAFESV
jgi:hypothetical protein